MSCTSVPFDSLVSVVMTATVATSTMSAVGAAVGDKMTLSLIADPTWVVRNIVGQGIVEDGIGPFGICDEDFKLSFSSGIYAHLKPPPPPAPLGAPIAKDAVSTGSLGLPEGSATYWFSLMKSRPVDDGFFVSTLADKGSAGVPLLLHGASAGAEYTGVFDVRLNRNTVPTVHVSEAFGTYTKKDLVAGMSTIKLARDWIGNDVLTADFESLTIGAALPGKKFVTAPVTTAPKPVVSSLLTPTTTAAKAYECCWCDPDTPASATTKMGWTDKKPYQLVFSDEFNKKGRTFANGQDSKWTALEVGDTSNQGTAFYLPEQATIAVDDKAEGEDGVSALLILTENVSHTGDSPTGEKGVKMPFRSAMLQTWNKFCFTSGIVEYKARQPRGAGYWPALWLFGNLGRAVYQNSNTGLWPWSYDQCDEDLELPQTDPPQRISACDYHDYESEGLYAYQGRGATELDVLEGAVTNDGLKSYSVGSLQLSPGVPEYFKPPLFAYPTGDGSGKWYTGLSFGTGGTPYTDGVANNGWYGPPWGSSCPTGCPDALSGGLVGLDDLDTRYWKYSMEWKTGDDGYLNWYYDDTFVWGMSAASFGAYSVCEERAGVKSCHRTPARQIPAEPMSLVMNTAIGTWNGGKSALDGKHWPAHFYVDHVRVWQSEVNVGCDPPNYPTRKYIEKNAWMFGEAVAPSGYDTCPESYPQSAYDDAAKIKARSAKMKLKGTSSFTSPSTSLFGTTNLAAGLSAATGLGASSNGLPGGMGAALALGGFMIAIAGGYLYGVRTGQAKAAGAWPLASVAAVDDKFEAEYEEYQKYDARGGL